MRTKKYKTIRGLFEANGLRRMTLSDFQKGCLLDLKRREHFMFELPDGEVDKLCDLFASAICETKKAREKYAALISRKTFRSAGILDRLWVERGDKGFRGVYCAGQDWVSEVRCVQSILRG